MPSLWKSASVTGRGKPGPQKSIRGTISAPIPIPVPIDDDEFPIRRPGSTKATARTDDEFPMRKPGTGIASTIPPVVEPETKAPVDKCDEPEIESEPEPEPKLEPESDTEPPYEQASEVEREQGLNDELQVGLEPVNEKALEQGQEQVQEQVQVQEPEQPEAAQGQAVEQPQVLLPLLPSTPVKISEPGRTDPDIDIQPEPPLHPPPPPPPATGPSVFSGRPASRSPPQRISPRRTSPSDISPNRTTPPRTKQPSPPSRRATNPVLGAVRYSVVSEAPTTQSKDSPQRKKSTLRSALGRLFGRSKKKNGSGSQDSGRDSGLVGSSQHRSDPITMGRLKENPPGRSASLPITEFNMPLRSHSIGPDDIMAIESARDSLQAEAAGASSGAGVGAGAAAATGGRRRAATTTSRLFLQPRLRTTEFGAGLSPRPASSHGRGSRLADTNDPEDPNEIGRAITSDSGNGVRRRSRSLSGLQDFMGGRPGARRRSDEIRYWRESYDPGFMSPLSSNAQEDDTGLIDVSAPESPAVERPPKTPPQPFNFGPITTDMAGMKITQVASIDTRIGDLEFRAHKLERVVGQLCHAVPGFKTPFGDATPSQGEPSSRKPTFAYSASPPPPIPAIYRTISSDLKETPKYAASRRSVETDSHSQVSFGDAPTFIGSLHPPSSFAAQSQSLSVNATPPANPLDRPASNSTIRGAASLPAIGREAGGNSDERYAALAAQLETERAARQALEAQVKKLSERLNTLSTTMFAMVRGPSESRSQERLAPPSVGGHSSQPVKTLLVPPPEAVKALSVFETDDDDDDNEDEDEGTEAAGAKEIRLLESEVADDNLTEDDFQTPREDMPPLSYGAFGEELHPDDDGEADSDDPKRKKAARTLSLSQLTLGKGQRTQI
ncbi:hypothetical protein B0T24DRAFT_63919 [Lasiosphaeria ovina]|uniref:Uncharacterized protein n=1 Tax=Lasiosphaeria ovina TaxID=92902 RepID=A0AAE0NLU5_9PEZI|nr:hypothetical protein B0T24DRAFT_63919 [Lasiosphaeria ovina]